MSPNDLEPRPSPGPDDFLSSATDSQEPVRRRPKAKLCRATVDNALACRVTGKRLRVFFEHPKGLFLNVTPNGAAAYYLQFTQADGRRSETVIGAENQITPAIAKAKAEQLNAEMTLTGLSPVAAKRERIAQARAAKVQTFKAVSTAFTTAAETRKVARRTTEWRGWLLNKHILPRLPLCCVGLTLQEKRAGGNPKCLDRPCPFRSATMVRLGQHNQICPGAIFYRVAEKFRFQPLDLYPRNGALVEVRSETVLWSPAPLAALGLYRDHGRPNVAPCLDWIGCQLGPAGGS